jgi:hypothetical protein
LLRLRISRQQHVSGHSGRRTAKKQAPKSLSLEGTLLQVFLMWAGDQSHSIARSLKEFLEFVVRGPKYFISDDIEGGRLWRVTLAGELESTSFGIACLTRDNLRSHWLHFEAGALSKAVGQANVVPYLVGPRTTDVEGPLADFQMLVGDESGTRKLVSLLASRIDGTRSDVIDKSFGYVWADFAKRLEEGRALNSKVTDEPVRNEPALIREILDRIRRMEGRMESLQIAPKVPEQPKIMVDEQMLVPMKAHILSLLDSLEKETTQQSMDDAIAGWRERLKPATLSADEVLGIYRQAKQLESYLNR